MQIQVNTDKNIEGHEALKLQVQETVSKALKHLTEHITRVEVHISDENGDKSGPADKRCVMEARFQGRQPTAVTCDAATVAQAVSGAADKLESSIKSTLEKMREHR